MPQVRAATKVVEIVVPALKCLTVKDRQALSTITKRLPKVEIPATRFKAPYVELLTQLTKEVNWSKLTVAALKDLICYYS